MEIIEHSNKVEVRRDDVVDFIYPKQVKHLRRYNSSGEIYRLEILYGEETVIKFDGSEKQLDELMEKISNYW